MQMKGCVACMKALIAEFIQESNSFCPVVATITEGLGYRFFLGEDNLKAIEEDGTAIRGFYEVLSKENADIYISACARFGASGIVSKEASDIIMERIKRDISIIKPDIILMSLHGAMIVEGEPDGSGYVLEELRKVAGKGCVIAGTTDMHANMTARMLTNADYIVGYKTYPHMDLKERAIDAAKLAVNKFKNKIKDTCALAKIPLIFPAECGDTSDLPLVKLMERAEQIEKEEGILSVTVSCVQPWLNINEVGCAITVYANSAEKASGYAEELSFMLWNMREALQVETYTVDEAVKLMKKGTGKPVLFVFSADSPSAGASGDSVAVIRGLLKYADQFNSYANIVDAPVARLASEKGEGAVIDVDLGHSITRDYGEPLRHTWIVERVCPGEFVFKGPMYTGQKWECGKTVVLRDRNLHVLVMENRVDNCDPEMYNSCGLPVEKAEILSLRSANGYKAPYKGLYSQDFIMALPGASSPELDKMPFNNTGWEIYPVNKTVEYIPTAQVWQR
jgi:microcystin degradation protein MlrC